MLKVTAQRIFGDSNILLSSHKDYKTCRFSVVLQINQYLIHKILIHGRTDQLYNTYFLYKVFLKWTCLLNFQLFKIDEGWFLENFLETYSKFYMQNYYFQHLYNISILIFWMHMLKIYMLSSPTAVTSPFRSLSTLLQDIH